MFPTSVAIDQSMLVSWQRRLLNFIIDIAVAIALIFLIGIFAGLLALVGIEGPLNWFSTMDGLTDRFVTTIIMVCYLFVMELLTQRTVGKYITGTMVVTEAGTKPKAKAILIRALCRIFWIEALSFFSAYPRGWHDTSSNTYVVDARKYKSALQLRDSFEEIGTSQTY